MNELHERIKLKYWKHKDSSYYWKDLNNPNSLWEVFSDDCYFENKNFIENKDEQAVRLTTYELIDNAYINEFRYESIDNVTTYEVLYNEEFMWFKFYDYKDRQELYISINTGTLEANVYIEVMPLMVLLLGI